MRHCHSAPLSFSALIDLNLPIRESIVPWVRRKGHWQGACLWQSGWWTRVRPPRSFPKKATTSVGNAVATDLGEDRLNKKLDSACSRALFCLTWREDWCCRASCSTLSKIALSWTTISLTVALLHYLELFPAYSHIADKTWTSRHLHTNTKGMPPRE